MGNYRRKSVSFISKLSRFLILLIAKQIGQEKSGARKEQKSPNLSINISGKCLSLLKNLSNFEEYTRIEEVAQSHNRLQNSDDSWLQDEKNSEEASQVNSLKFLLTLH